AAITTKPSSPEVAMRQHVLRFSGQSSAPSPGSRRGTCRERSSATWTRRPATGRVLLAATIAMALGLQLVLGAPTASAADSQDGLINNTLIPGASQLHYTMKVGTLGQLPRQA